MNKEAQAEAPTGRADAPPDVPEEEKQEAQETTIILANYMGKKNLGIIVNGQDLILNHNRQTTFKMKPGVTVLGIGFYDKSDLKRKLRIAKQQVKSKTQEIQ